MARKLIVQRRWRLLSVAAAATAVVVAVSSYLAASDDDEVAQVVTSEDVGTSTTTTAVQEPTETTSPVDDPPPAPTSTAPDTTSSTTVAPPTTVPARESHLDGSVDWPQRDPRGRLGVAACPSTDTHDACWSTVVAPVGEDGTFTLTLPPTPEGTTWRVAAYVRVDDMPWHPCVFSCVWPTSARGVVRGAVVEVGANVDQTLALSIAARVVDVFVRDRNDQPFQGPIDANGLHGGGVTVTDERCWNDAPCPEELEQMFAQASPPDGATRLVLNPHVRYALHGQAMNMDWPDPQFTIGSNVFWNSPDEVMSGAELDEGHVFRVSGAPSS